MLYRIVGIALICSLLVAGCVTTTQTCGPLGFCGPAQTTSWPESNPPPQEESDHTGTIVAVGAIVTAVALLVVLAARDKSDPPEKPKPVAQQAREVSYVMAPVEDDADRRRQRMFVQAHISARAGRCEAVVAIGKNLAIDSPSYHERYVADPTIARCLSEQRL